MKHQISHLGPNDMDAIIQTGILHKELQSLGATPSSTTNRIPS